jgi:hypothetical protein
MRYGGGRVPALRFFYKVSYAVGFYDDAMRGAVTGYLMAAALEVQAILTAKSFRDLVS